MRVYKIMNGINRLDPRQEYSSIEHSMNEPEVIVRSYSWGAVDSKYEKNLIQPARGSGLELIIRSCCHSPYPKLF